MIERLHRYIKERLRILAVDKGLDFLQRDDWDIYCSSIQFAYNTTKNRMTGYAPYTIISGSEVTTPSKIQRLNSEKQNQTNAGIITDDVDTEIIKHDSKKDLQQFIKEMNNRKALINKTANETQAKYDSQRQKCFAQRQKSRREKRKSSQEQEDKSSNETNKKSSFNIGDTVLYYVGDKYVGNQKKLQPQYSDIQYRIIDIKNDGNTLTIEDDLKNQKIVHRTKVKRYISSEIRNSNIPSGRMQIDSQNNENVSVKAKNALRIVGEN